MLMMAPQQTAQHIRNVREAMSRSMEKLRERDELLLMTPGPTEIPPMVREAMVRPIEHPYAQKEFIEFYHSLEEKLQRIYGTEDDMVIVGGEGILGLEASMASLLDPGDEVLCISNGIYGDGFKRYVKMYGGEPTVCSFPYDGPILIEELEHHLEQNDFDVATMVHCETPTGTLNDLDMILKRLKEECIVTVVDAVSSIGGVPVPVENMDICISGSQKCFSSPPGLTPISISDEAWDMIMDDKEDKSFYTSLKAWKETWLENESFPYTPLVSNLYALDESAGSIIREGIPYVYARHEDAANMCRKRGKDMGLELFPKEEELCSNTVTAFEVEGNAVQIQKRLKKEHGILVATGLGEMKEDIIRIGHMGFNAKRDKVKRTMDALEKVVK